MQKEIKHNSDVQKNSENEVASKKRTNFEEIGRAELRSAGRLCITMLRAIIVAARACFIPSVYAAPPPEPPKRPKPMRYRDLPIYESPHYEYKDYEADKAKCQQMDTKIIHNYLHPHVSAYRKEVEGTLSFAKNEIIDTYKEVTTDLRKAEKSIKSYMRDPANDTIRKSFMAFGAATGLYLGRGGLASRQLFFGGLGILAAGSICYPKETDEGFRTFLFYTGKGLVAAYNSFCGKNFAFREPLPCAKDAPKQPPPTQRIKECQPKK